MKLSKSKLALAKVINENGGWPSDEATFAAQDKIDGESNENTISFYSGKVKPTRLANNSMWRCEDAGSHFIGYEKTIKRCKLLANWHQTCISREEYYQAYPKADADGWIEWGGGECPVCIDDVVDVMQLDGHTYTARAVNFHWLLKSGSVSVAAYRLHKPEVKPEFCESVTHGIPEPESIDGLCAKVTEENKHQHVDAKLTIEQLAQDYRNKLDYANSKQREADDAKAASDAALCELERAGEAIGLLIGIAKPEPELEITDWRDLQVGDLVSWKIVSHRGEFKIISVHHDETREIGDFEIEDESGVAFRCYGNEVTFIRRP